MMISIHYLFSVFSLNAIDRYKNKEYFEKTFPKKMCKYDHINYIITDSYLWSMAILLPIIININGYITWASFMGIIVNGIIRGIIEDLRINKKIINAFSANICYIFQIPSCFYSVVQRAMGSMHLQMHCQIIWHSQDMNFLLSIVKTSQKKKID